MHWEISTTPVLTLQKTATVSTFRLPKELSKHMTIYFSAFLLTSVRILCVNGTLTCLPAKMRLLINIVLYFALYICYTKCFLDD